MFLNMYSQRDFQCDTNYTPGQLNSMPKIILNVTVIEFEGFIDIYMIWDSTITECEMVFIEATITDQGLVKNIKIQKSPTVCKSCAKKFLNSLKYIQEMRPDYIGSSPICCTYFFVY